MNAERAKASLKPFVEDPKLTAMAQYWAQSMARTGVMSHAGFARRMGAVFPNCYASENVACGYADAASVVRGWMNSPGHRANIMGQYTNAGAGLSASANYWCADFASPHA
jgi:uncharacterized protein YkwD